MAITISGENNNDRILASDGVIDQISGINIVGLITASHINVGSNINLGNAGIITATTFVGNVTGNVNSTSPLLLQTGGSERFRITGNNELGIAGANYGSSGQVLTSGGSGSAVTWSAIPAQATIANNADNRVITGGSGVNLNGEANLTYNGSNLQFNTTANGNAVILKSTGNYYNKLSFDSGNTSAGGELAYVDFSWDGDKVADILALAGSDTTNKDDGHLVFRTSPQQGNIGERLRITSDGKIGIGGETSPEFKVTVYDAGYSGVTLKSNRTSATDNIGGLHFKTQSTNVAYIQSLVDGTIKFRNSSSLTERLRIHADGEVDVKGGAAGQNALLVTGNYSSSNNVDIQTWQRIGGAVQAKMIYKDAGTTMHFGTDTAHNFLLMTGGTDRIKIASNSAATSIGGNLTFNAMLTVQGDISGELLRLKATEGTSRLMVSGTNTNGIEMNLYDEAGGQKGILGVSGTEFFIKAPNSSAPMTFYTHNGSSMGERLRIDSSGRLLMNGAVSGNAFSGGDDIVIGSTSARSGITLVSSTSNDGGLYFSKGTSSNSDNVKGQIVYQHDGDGGYFRLFTNASERVRIFSDGRVQIAGQNAIATTSLTHRLLVRSQNDSNAIAIAGRNGDHIGELSFYQSDASTRMGEIQAHTTHLELTSRLGYLSLQAGGTDERVRIGSGGEVSLRRGGISATPSLEIYGSGNASDTDADNLRIHNWGDSDGDYWKLGVNCGLNGSGNSSKPSNTLKGAAVTIDGRFGRVFLQTSPSSSSTVHNALIVDSNGIIRTPLQPAFRSYTVSDGNGNGTVSGIWNTGSNDTRKFDNNDDFNESNGRFTAPVDGVYQISVAWDENNVSTIIDVQINGGSVNLYSTEQRSAGSGWNSWFTTSITKMSSGDYVTINLRNASGSYPFHQAGGRWGHFSVYLIG